MSQMTNTIIIDEYREEYALAIAKMWNLSRDSWGGDTRVHTEESVKTKEANAGNIALYLAIDGEEVVGYCSLSEYKEDVDSLYIPLLNVRPDYHGKKIGKMLVMKAVEKTIELGWPRVDLYTWPGNVKAVPLYKKCGFFWEDRDDTTHLMNFIPAVINTPLLKPIFEKVDWYDASIREIEVKPDGLKENGFTYYQYEWKDQQTNACVRFERSGRGISFIETDDYLLELKMADHEVIEEMPQKVELIFVNKTANPVLLKVDGNDHERTESAFKDEIIVEKRAVLSDQVIFKAGEEPSEWNTHPFFSVNVSINGEECELRLGVKPKPPAKLTAKIEGNLSFLGEKKVIELEVENSVKEEAVFDLVFSSDEHVELDRSTFSVSLKKNERKLVAIPFVVKKFGYYQPHIAITAKIENGSEHTFENNLVGIALKGFGEKFGGETKDFWHIYNGSYQVNIRKRDYLITAGRNQQINQPFAFFVPKLGKPYSTELSKKKPAAVDWYFNDTEMIFKMVFHSAEIAGVTLTLYTALYGDGIVKKWAEVENDSKETIQQLYLNQSLYHEKSHVYFPLEKDVIEFSEIKAVDFGDIHSHHLTGNWYFTKDHGEPIGLCWPTECKANLEGWQFYLEYELGAIQPKECKRLEPCYLSIGAFRTWQEQMAFANKVSNVVLSQSISEKALKLENNNPVVYTDQLALELRTSRTSFINGPIELFINGESKLSAQISSAEERTKFQASISVIDAQPISIITGSIQSDSTTTSLNQLMIVPKGKVEAFTEAGQGITSYVLDNGIIRIKAAPEFYPGLYSLIYHENEWFDTSFPEKVAKGWWNPWAGGMKTSPAQLNTFSLMKECTTAEFMDIEDKHGNQWSSIALHTKIGNHPIWKGLQYTQFFALLPGVPVLAYFVKIVDSGGKSLLSEILETDLFLTGDSLKDLTAISQFSDKKINAGIEEQGLNLKNVSYINSENRTEKLYHIEGEENVIFEGYMNKEAFEVILLQEIKNTTKPGFILFDQREISKTILESLRGIVF
ncbi:GNAT family N-acetyltransferase [Cytobacillus praedii]|uniref:GNAT family N-acetyltransferase n=1 Tax=Cytobacillus praedii TaxID=1742358 RepID=A0A4R1AZG6_9BACI|nr:GNAT family N-acetyltransferase [Cytobacillus praedii]TCJ05405.1 GNAT family N-acetyltransferase [Cytobacillus praedii]